MISTRIEIYRAFRDGMVTAIAAHFAAALAFVSTERVGQFIGHVVGIIGLRLLGEWLR